MNIIHARPPNFAEIVAAFPGAARPEVIFSFGSDLYVPGGGKVSQELMAHEAVHGARQNDIGILWWWQRYIADDTFRLDEEVLAHVAEYRRYCKRVADNNKRVRELFKIAERLTSPLYGNLLSQDEAIRRIKA